MSPRLSRHQRHQHEAARQPEVLEEGVGRHEPAAPAGRVQKALATIAPVP
jgi:hypothetical protein